ncbi:MFS transporter [Piscinibacter sakaiensis]|uniref:MFS transporter n=1 Tax=Piscinibacter sakaiensis TaxID=1547922 RepID=UPI003AAE18F3
MIIAVTTLGLAQITAWGTSFYCLGVLAKPIAADTGWTLSLIYLGFTVAVLMMGAVSTWAGRATDRYGAQRVMAVGVVLVSVALALLAISRSEGWYLGVWALLGIGMRLCLYDTAFAGLVQVVPSRGRLAISYLTLFGAFASTIFWVLGHQLEQAYGWRWTLAAFAAINLVVCLPLNWIGLSRREAPGVADNGAAATEKTRAASIDGPPLTGQPRRIAIGLLALVMALNGLVFGVVTVQLVPLLEAAQLSTTAAVWIASTKGFGQFAGRVVEIVFGRHLRAITVARLAIGALPWSFVVLLLGAGHFHALLLFTLLMGASQGVITIVRGALPLALFGSAGYGAVLGLLATPVLIVNAGAPTLFALIVDGWGWEVAEVVLLVAAAASWLTMEGMARWYQRQRAVVVAQPGH